MKYGWPISILLHGVLVGGSVFVFSKVPDISDEGFVVPVELLTIDEFTNIRAAIKVPELEKITPPDIPMQLERPMDNAKEQGNAQERSVTDIALPPAQNVPGEKNKAPASEKIKPPTFDLDSMSALIDKAREAQPEIDQQQALQSELNFYEYAQNAREGTGLGTELTMSELDALQSAMYKCWRIPLDAKNPEELIVRVKVSLRSDGHVQSAELVDRAAISSSTNPYLSVAAQRAVNAISKCAPYDFLPLDKYDSWKNMTLSFKPEL